MKIPYEYFVGIRFLMSKKKNALISLTTVISIFGILIGVFVLIVVLSVQQGLEDDLKEKIIGNSAHIELSLLGSSGITNYENLIYEIEKIDGIKNAYPAIYKEGMLISNLGISAGVIIKGVSVQSEKRNSLPKFIDGKKKFDLNAFKESNPPKILIGEELARDILARKGDKIKILTPTGEITPFGDQPRISTFEIFGIFKTGFWEFDSKFIFISIENAQKKLSLGNAVHYIEVFVNNVDNIAKVKNKIMKDKDFNFYITDWRQKHSALFKALSLEKTVMFIILIMIVLVAAFNIISTLIMIVMEKGKDIAVLKSLGGKSKSIMKIFTICGMIIGVVGTMFGTFFGLFACYLIKYHIKYPLNPEVYFTDLLPVKVNFLNVVIVVCSALLICLLATLYPSYKASRIDPCEKIRYE